MDLDIAIWDFLGIWDLFFGISLALGPWDFAMRIVINHLTRMRRGYICTAGIDLANGQHVRPIPRSGDLRYRDLATHGGELHWDGRDRSGSPTPAGIYFVRFRGDAGSVTRRVVKLTP